MVGHKHFALMLMCIQHANHEIYRCAYRHIVTNSLQAKDDLFMILKCIQDTHIHVAAMHCGYFNIYFFFVSCLLQKLVKIF